MTLSSLELLYFFTYFGLKDLNPHVFVEFTFSTDKDAVMSVWKQSNTRVVAQKMPCLFYLQTVEAPVQVVSVQCAAVLFSLSSFTLTSLRLSLQGPTGPAGETGLPGPQGPQGPQGPSGRSIIGPPVGARAHTHAHTELIQTEKITLFYLQGGQGERGQKGDIGQPGPQVSSATSTPVQ